MTDAPTTEQQLADLRARMERIDANWSDWWDDRISAEDAMIAIGGALPDTGEPS